MRSEQLFLLSFLATVVSGCGQDVAPSCILGDEKCENGEDSGIYYVCKEDNLWSTGILCDGLCDGTRCSKKIELTCQNEGERRCVDSIDFSMTFVCRNHLWFPTTCEASCEDNHCVPVSTCSVGDAECMYVDFLDRAVSLICQDGVWVTDYCPSGVACLAGICGKAPTGRDKCKSGDACKQTDLVE